MKKNIILGIILIIAIGAFYFFTKEEVIAPVVTDTTNEEKVIENTEDSNPIELCFTKFGEHDENGFYDKYTLRMTLDGEKDTGELKLLPAEKDALVGKFEGTVVPVDRMVMTRTANLIWDAEGEGMNAKQELKIIFAEGTASIGFGEMIDRGNGVYVYKNPTKVDYSFYLTDTSCLDLDERESVEGYLWSNIGTLSPVKSVLGGSWYVVSMDVDLEKNSGAVTYEDGHIQEKRDFTYTTNWNREVESLTIN